MVNLKESFAERPGGKEMKEEEGLCVYLIESGFFVDVFRDDIGYFAIDIHLVAFALRVFEGGGFLESALRFLLLLADRVLLHFEYLVGGNRRELGIDLLILDRSIEYWQTHFGQEDQAERDGGAREYEECQQDDGSVLGVNDERYGCSGRAQDEHVVNAHADVLRVVQCRNGHVARFVSEEASEELRRQT